MQRATLRLSVLLLATAAACSDAPFETVRPEGDPLLEQITALGLRADMVVDHGDFYIVEGDIKLNKRDLMAAAGSPAHGPRFQYHTTNTVSNPAAIHQIKVDLSHLASHSGWYNAAVEALTHWSAVPNSYVKMVQGSPADITLRLVNDVSGVAGWAKFPGGGAPGDTVYLNANFYPGFTPTHAVYLRNVVHELGHAIGFRHTNWNSADCRNIYGQVVSCNWNSGAAGAHHIWGTPTSGGDANSVMNGLTAQQSWIGFSTHDRTATARLYPLPYPASMSSSHPVGTVVLQWAPVTGALHYQVQYSETFRSDDYERGYHSHTTAYGWSPPLYATTVDTGEAWTGNWVCRWYDGPYGYEETEYRYEVRAVFATGASMAISVGAETATC